MATPEKIRLQQFLYRIRTSMNAVLQYKPLSRNLGVWYWPAERNGARVVPSDLEAHRTSHNVLGPCCLCPFESVDAGGFKESAIYMAGHGRYGGEYVAACATRTCEYFVPMERVHAQRGVPIRRYGLRDVNDPAPPPVMDPLDAEVELRFLPRGRQRDNDIDLRLIRICPGPDMGPKAVFNLLLRLDSIMNPGLPIVQFYQLFAKCDRCGLVMTRRVFQSHDCVLMIMDEDEEAEVIDLTMDDDE